MPYMLLLETGRAKKFSYRRCCARQFTSDRHRHNVDDNSGVLEGTSAKERVPRSVIYPAITYMDHHAPMYSEPPNAPNAEKRVLIEFPKAIA